MVGETEALPHEGDMEDTKRHLVVFLYEIFQRAAG
jgi:hypothetical protein